MITLCYMILIIIIVIVIIIHHYYHHRHRYHHHCYHHHGFCVGSIAREVQSAHTRNIHCICIPRPSIHVAINTGHDDDDYYDNSAKIDDGGAIMISMSMI